MSKRLTALVAAAAVFVCTAQEAPAKGPVPAKLGQCVMTAVKAIGSRLEGVADSGSAIQYLNGLYQVSYDMVPGIQSSRAGDKIKICLTELPQDCPPGDDRGKTYTATNLRTHRSWEAADSQHMCGGA